MTKILVAYYSRTGFTRTVDRQIASLCHADLESIKSLSWHHHGFGYARSALGAIFHWKNSTRRTKHDPKDYDIVAIGTPEGSGQAKVMRDLRALTERAPIATLSMTDQEIQGKRHQDRIREFAVAVERVACSEDPSRVAEPYATETRSVDVADLAR